MALESLPKLLTKADVAEYFDVCVKTVNNHIAQGLLPPPIPFGAKEYWHIDVFHAFLERTFNSSAEALERSCHVEQVSQVAPVEVASRAPTPRPRSGESAASFRQRVRQEAKLRKYNAVA